MMYPSMGRIEIHRLSVLSPEEALSHVGRQSCIVAARVFVGCRVVCTYIESAPKALERLRGLVSTRSFG